MKKRGKKGIVTEYLPWMILAIAVLAIIMFIIFSMKEQGFTLIDKIKGLLRG